MNFIKTIKNTIIYLLIFSILTSLTSCATVMNGTYQSIGVASNPSNASVWVDQAYVGNTPIIIGVSRGDNHIVRIELEHYQPYEIVFSRQLSGWVFGNILFGFGGFIGLAVDAISGGIYRLTPDQVQAEMRSNDMRYVTHSKDSEGPYVFIVLKPNDSWEKVGDLVAKN